MPCSTYGKGRPNKTKNAGKVLSARRARDAARKRAARARKRR